MRRYVHVFCGLLAAGVVVALAGCGSDENPGPVRAKDLGTQKGEVLVPYEPAISRKITQDPSQFPMPAAPPPVETPAAVAAEAAAVAGGDLEPAGDEDVTLARQVVQSLATGQYAKVTGSFDANMKARLPESQLQSTWQAILMMVGPFKEQGAVQRKQAQGQEVAVVSCRMENAGLDVQVAFNADKQISGLYIEPTGAVAAPMPAADPQNDAIIRQFVESLVQGNFDQASTAMRGSSKPDELKDMWTQTTGDVGAFKRIALTGQEKKQQLGMDVTEVSAVCEFANGYIRVTVIRGADGKGIGFMMGTAAAPEAGGAAPAPPAMPAAPAAPTGSGSRSANMDMLPPTAPAPVGLGN
jgi:hypothetical protein